MKKSDLIRTIIGLILFISSFFIKSNVNIILIYISYILIAYNIILNMVDNIKNKEFFDENTLMFIATIGALMIGENHEAIIVVLLYQIGELLSDRAVIKSKDSIIKLMDLRTDIAHLKNGADINPENIEINDVIIVKPGEKIPLDGIVVNGESEIDTKSLTGESIPKVVRKNDEVLSGTINMTGVIEIKVTKLYNESTVYKILELMESASERKTKTEKFITKFSKVYTPIVVVFAILLTLIPVLLGEEFNVWIYRSLTFLVISCPCALVISIPLGFFVGIGRCSKNGILVKGSNELEKLDSIDTVVFDKTGTLTKGNFSITKVIPLNKTKKELLKYAAYAEFYSNHPIASAIKKEYKGKVDEKFISNYQEISGKGIKLKVENDQIIVGNASLFEQENIVYPKVEFIGTVVLVAVNGEYIGTIVISDELKENSINIANDLRNIGIKKVVMLSGDNHEIVRKIGKKLKMDESYAELLPTDKVDILTEIKKDANVLFMGDGINDAPVLALSDLGVSMGGVGSDAAIEACDIVIMNDDPYKIIEAIEISGITKKTVKQNIIFSIFVKILILILSAIGITNMWLAVFADVGVTLLAVLNSLKIIKKFY